MRAGSLAAVQVATMAAIVATLVYAPLGLVVALGARLLGISFEDCVTFGGEMHAALGLLVWWLLAFAAAIGYAVSVFPWHEKVLTWPRSK